jgi:DNA-directed RNA polymerase subunit RPC12/RpoP
MALEKIDLTCPKCGGNMERDAEHKSIRCPYCGHEVILQSTEDNIEKKAYERQRGILHANAEAERAKKRSKLKGFFIAACVIVAFSIAAAVYSAAQPKVDPFEYITLSFSGTTGEGTAELVYLDDVKGEVDPHKISYRLEQRSFLTEGGSVVVTAQSSEYNLSPKSKTFKVTGLDTYLSDLDSLSKKAIKMIHNKSDMTANMAVKGAGTSVKPSSVKKHIMYLTTDGKKGNTLYDVYKVAYPEKNGGSATRYVVVYYTNIVVRDTEEPTMSYSRTMYTGQVIEALDKSYGGYMTGYKSLKDVKADILSHQSKAVTLQERKAGK